MSSPGLLPRSKQIITEQMYQEWLVNSQKGDRIEYHQGFLVSDSWPPEDPKARELGKLAGKVYESYEKGYTVLAQRRMCKNTFGYIAIRGKKPIDWDSA